MSDEKRSCADCGAPAPADARFCPKCATPMEEKKPEPAAESGEERTLWSGRYCFKAMIGWIVLLIVWWIVVGIVWFESETTTNFTRWFFGILAGAPALWLKVEYLRRRFRGKFVLTSRRLLYKKGLFGRAIVDLDLRRLTDVSTHQRLIHRFVDAGDVTAYCSEGEHTRLDIRGISGPVRLKERIRQAAAEARAGLG